MFASSGRILGVLGPVERDIELLVGRQSTSELADWSALQGRRVRDGAVTVWGCRDGAPINIAPHRLRTGEIVAIGAQSGLLRLVFVAVCSRTTSELGTLC